MSTTLRDLVALVHEGKFREEFVLSAECLCNFPASLRERGSDVLTLAGTLSPGVGNPKKLNTVAAKALCWNIPQPGNAVCVSWGNLMLNLRSDCARGGGGSDDLNFSGQTPAAADSDGGTAPTRLSYRYRASGENAAATSITCRRGKSAWKPLARLGINRQLLYSKLESTALLPLRICFAFAIRILRQFSRR